MSFENPDLQTIKRILQDSRHIAVVGLSPKPVRPSFQVSRAMQDFGYHIIPVRPALAQILGETVYPDLQSVPGPIDIVNVFRAGDKIAPLVDSCIALRPDVLWLQDGVVNEPEARRAEAAGITVIMDRCIYRDYLTLVA